MPEPRSLALSRLVKDNEMLSEMEVASVVAPLIERLRGLHAAGRAHGNVSLATVAIRVVEPADGTIHLPDPGCCDPAARPCRACQQTEEGATAAADVWSVGVIALQLLLGRPCRSGCEHGVVGKESGELPLLPRGTSLECIEFLMGCLEPRPEDRASAAELLALDFLRANAAPPGPTASHDAASALADSLADVLLISSAGKTLPDACRPAAVPALRAKGRVSFTTPSQTARSTHERSAPGTAPSCAAAAAAEAPNGAAAHTLASHKSMPPARSRSPQTHMAAARTSSSASTQRSRSPHAHAGASRTSSSASAVSPQAHSSAHRSCSAACTKRRLDDAEPAAPGLGLKPELKRQKSEITKYLSPAILPQSGDLPDLILI